MFREEIANRIICHLTKKYRLYPASIYEMLWKLRADEVQWYSMQVEKSRKECGGFTHEDWKKWFWSLPENKMLRKKRKDYLKKDK